MGITVEEPGRDGLECAVIRFSRFDDQLQFAGAGIDLFVVSETGQSDCVGPEPRWATTFETTA